MAKKQKKHHEHGQGGRWLIVVDGVIQRDGGGRLVAFRERWAAEQYARGYTGASVRAG